ncbi:hypothetical protein GCM10007172_12770 [Sinomonas atrocyanea]|nr:hypothetical protein GCM10007172_12770 [Sinomonas atrocyanea]
MRGEHLLVEQRRDLADAAADEGQGGFDDGARGIREHCDSSSWGLVPEKGTWLFRIFDAELIPVFYVA